VITFLSKVKYTISNAIVLMYVCPCIIYENASSWYKSSVLLLVTYQISY